MKAILAHKYFKGSQRKADTLKKLGIVRKTNTAKELYETFEKLSYRQLVSCL